VLFWGSGDVVLGEWEAWISRVRSVDEDLMYCCGERSGEGARLEDGQESVYPAGNLTSGMTRKLRFETAL
jgi:hypothetical protein